jgi:hypothetical protein
VPALPPDDRPGKDESDGLYTMAVASRLTGMHPQTLRKYERAGLIRPTRQSGNQRLYSEADVRRLRRIRYLVEVRGVNIAGLELMPLPVKSGLGRASANYPVATTVSGLSRLSPRPRISQGQLPVLAL